MADTESFEQHRNEELVLVDRLVHRQGVTLEEALRLVDDHRQGKRAEIDPALMEGLETI